MNELAYSIISIIGFILFFVVVAIIDYTPYARSSRMRFIGGSTTLFIGAAFFIIGLFLFSFDKNPFGALLLVIGLVSSYSGLTHIGIGFIYKFFETRYLNNDYRVKNKWVLYVQKMVAVIIYLIILSAITLLGFSFIFNTHR